MTARKKQATKKTTAKPAKKPATKKLHKAPKAKAAKSSIKIVKQKMPKGLKEPKLMDNRNYMDEPNFPTTAREGELSGAFIKRMLETNALTNQEIIQAVKENFHGSSVSASDIGFHRSKLKAAGTETKVVRVDKKGGRYTL